MFKKYFSLFCLIVFVGVLAVGCANQNIPAQQSAVTNFSVPQQSDYVPEPVEFSGDAGQKVIATDGQIVLNSAVFDDGLAHYYNYDLNGKDVYFFVVKDQFGVYRAAGNACQVCADAKMGFRQEGNFMVCNTCGNKYPLEKIATEKGGCNPVPINPNLQVQNGQLIINGSELQVLNSYF